MKLQTRYSQATIISSISVLLIAGIGYYFLLHYVLNKQLDEALRVEEVEIVDYITKKHALPEATTFKDQRIEFKKVTSVVPRRFSTVKVYEPEEKEYELSRQLIFTVKVEDDYYAASVTKSQEEIERLVGLILLITLGLILLLGILLFFFNRFILKRLWRPFYDNLSAIKQFDLNAPLAIKFQQTRIDEFNEMNASVNVMTGKVVRDYMSLKNFADHASHEMQTPLAVINSRLDVLIQDPGLSETSLHQIQSIYNSVEKMSRLCQSLLLLTKIENNQFTEKKSVNIVEIVKNKLIELEEWTQENLITIKTNLDELNISMNRQLADILISNLIINAVKHSNADKKVEIFLEKNSFIISNPGETKLDTALIFDRFWKSEYSDGTGLGLAIVKHICAIYCFKLSYDYKEGRHFFRIIFNAED
ncbi:MAG: HAMP domain-containing sensor histidine kinase [Chitinophagaceae bacterium]